MANEIETMLADIEARYSGSMCLSERMRMTTSVVPVLVAVIRRLMRWIELNPPAAIEFHYNTLLEAASEDVKGGE